MISIIIPHKHTPDNDAALELALQSIKKNSYCPDHEIIVDDDPECPYRVWNRRSERAKYPILVFSNSDVIFAKNWDVNFVKWCGHKQYLSGWLVECGVIPVNSRNVEHNFGKKPSEFQEDEFERFVVSHSAKCPEMLHEEGWYMPCAISRSDFLEVGGFPTQMGRFPDPLDYHFVAKIKKLPKWEMCRVNSWAYHFQCLSGRPR
jgi:hypothetical protein